MAKYKRRELSLKDKIELIKVSDQPGNSQRKLAAQFGIGKTQVQSILKRKAEYMTAYEDNDKENRKRLCLGPQLDDIESATWEWFKRARAMGLTISGPMIQEQALRIAERLNHADFKASNGWLDRFRKRHNITFGAVCGERGSVDNATVTSWKEKLPTILEGYAPRDIYNMDETGLFFRALPEKSLREKGDSCAGGKKSKDRITASICVNSVGEFEKVLVIGHAQNPHCFKNISSTHLPVSWTWNKKAWMTSQLFEDWIKGFNRRMSRQGRSVILFLDNAPSHPRDLELSHVKLVFLPPNCTSVLQPLDHGIIQNVKLLYRKRMLRHVLNQVDSSDSASDCARSVTVLDACQWLAASVNEIKPSTVEKCFSACGLICVPTVQLPPESDDDDEDSLPLSHLLRLAKDRQICDNIITDPQDYASIDEQLHSTDSIQDGWEERLLDDLFGTNTTETADTESTTGPSADTSVPDTAVTVKPALTMSKAVKMATELKDFMEEGCPELWQHMCFIQDKLQLKALLNDAKKKQQTLEHFL